ncbi:MAG: MotA/TolQ/ExbB proton channel family protein [Xenococcaceae cyanobacterium MO_188.B32]|nr:MotA/TolQ/ExbB proton channel family protein [Xenococcaceae cyanobacterium MO_188.B32]
MLTNPLWTLGGIVTLPLLGFSLLAVALIIERIVFWTRLKRKQRRVVREVLSLYRSEPFSAIKKLQNHADLPIARIFLAAMELENPTAEEFRLALESSTQGELATLRRFNTLFQTIITISPLLGLLGTILGLIRSFSSMELGNIASSNTEGVTGGLGEALVSTVMGLVVAIFTLLFANAFRGLYLRELASIQELSGQLELIYRRFHQGVRNYASTD